MTNILIATLGLTLLLAMPVYADETESALPANDSTSSELELPNSVETCPEEMESPANDESSNSDVNAEENAEPETSPADSDTSPDAGDSTEPSTSDDNNSSSCDYNDADDQPEPGPTEPTTDEPN